MTLPSQRKASAAYHARREDAGWRKLTIWLDADSLRRLAALREVFGSNDASVAAALKVLAGD